MTTKKAPRVELVYFEGCPNVERARENIRSAARATNASRGWIEWELTSEATPESYRRYGSPTVLVDGRDVAGDGQESEALACRADGAPSEALIAQKLRTGPGTQ